MPAVHRLALHAVPSTYGELLLDYAIWHFACQSHGVDNALAPTSSSAGVYGSEWTGQLCTLAISQAKEFVGAMLELERRCFSASPAEGARGADIFEVISGAGVVFGGFYIREEDVAEWTRHRTHSVPQPQHHSATALASVTFDSTEGKPAAFIGCAA